MPDNHDETAINVVDYANAEHQDDSGSITPAARKPEDKSRGQSQLARTGTSPTSRPRTSRLGSGETTSSGFSTHTRRDHSADSTEDGRLARIPSGGPLSPTSSTASFVFPVRSAFANYGNKGQKAQRNQAGVQLPHNRQQQQYQSQQSGPLPTPRDMTDGTANRDRSPSLPGTAGTSISSILAQGESIQHMLEGHTYDLSEIHKSLSWTHMDGNPEAGPSRGFRPPGMEGNGCYSAPLPTVPETSQNTYFIDALLNEERRRSDGQDRLGVNSDSPYRSTSPVFSPPPEKHANGTSASGSSTGRAHSPGPQHAHGQIDPAPKDAPAPGQTTFRSNDEEARKTYSFSHHPRKDTPIDLSGPSDGKRIKPSRNASNRNLGELEEDEDEEQGEGEQDDDLDDRPRAVMLGDNFQSNGLGDTGEDRSDESGESGESGSRTDTIHPIRRLHEPREPDVGPGEDGSNGGEVVDSDATPKEDKKQEEGGLSGVATPSGNDSAGEQPRSRSAASSNGADLRPFESGITLLGGRAGEDNASSSYGTRTSSLRGSKDALHSAMRGGKKQNQAQVSSVPDYQSSVQKFVDRQAEQVTLSDPNAPTPSPGPGDPSNLSRDDNMTSTTDEDDNMSMDAESAQLEKSSQVQSESELTNPGEEPLMTIRFEHVTTEDGHHVVTGREGQLEKCEDEVSH
jgi:hypothetical protein